MLIIGSNSFFNRFNTIIANIYVTYMMRLYDKRNVWSTEPVERFSYRK